VKIWLTMAVAGALTFLTRLSFIFLLDRIRMPDWFQRALRFVPIAVLSAIIVPALAERRGIMDLSWRNPQLIAGAIAVLVAWRTRNVLLTIACGMGALVAFQALIPGA
jgi:branched-subunit amino acid transport protein